LQVLAEKTRSERTLSAPHSAPGPVGADPAFEELYARWLLLTEEQRKRVEAILRER
jgi:hypothetical protein